MAKKNMQIPKSTLMLVLVDKLKANKMSVDDVLKFLKTDNKANVYNYVFALEEIYSENFVVEYSKTTGIVEYSIKPKAVAKLPAKYV